MACSSQLIYKWHIARADVNSPRCVLLKKPHWNAAVITAQWDVGLSSWVCLPSTYSWYSSSSSPNLLCGVRTQGASNVTRFPLPMNSTTSALQNISAEISSLDYIEIARHMSVNGLHFHKNARSLGRWILDIASKCSRLLPLVRAVLFHRISAANV